MPRWGHLRACTVGGQFRGMGHGDSRFHGARQPIIRDSKQTRLGTAREPTQQGLCPPPHSSTLSHDFLHLRRTRRALGVGSDQQQTTAICLDLLLDRCPSYREFATAMRRREQRDHPTFGRRTEELGEFRRAGIDRCFETSGKAARRFVQTSGAWVQPGAAPELTLPQIGDHLASVGEHPARQLFRRCFLSAGDTRAQPDLRRLLGARWVGTGLGFGMRPGPSGWGCARN